MSDTSIARVGDALRDRFGTPGDALVEHAMTPNPFSCTPEAHLHAVAKEMAQRKIGCAVVLHRDHPTEVIGLFTTTDALLALSVLAPQE